MNAFRTASSRMPTSLIEVRAGPWCFLQNLQEAVMLTCATMLERMSRDSGSRRGVRDAAGGPVLGPERGEAQWGRI